MFFVLDHERQLICLNLLTDVTNMSAHGRKIKIADDITYVFEQLQFIFLFEKFEVAKWGQSHKFMYKINYGSAI